MSDWLMIGGVVFFISMSIQILFLVENKQNVELFLRRIEKLKNKITKNESQIDARQQYLNRYNFLKYNLREALRIELKIKL
jgi:hypothetical protein